MPIVYACVVPITPPLDEGGVADALGIIIQELAGYEPELILSVMPAASGASKINLFASDSGLLSRLVSEAKQDAIPAERLMSWRSGGAAIAIGAESHAYIGTCGLDTRLHFEAGRATARATSGDERRIAVVCAVELSKSNERFDAQFRRALSGWDVKSIVNMDVRSRHSAREHAVRQIALLMGLLGGYRVQPRELGYEARAAGGYSVVAIDVLGRRNGAS